MKKVIYLIEQPLDERNYERFGIQTWIDRSWSIEIWDLTPLSYPRVWQNFIDSRRTLKDFYGYFPITAQVNLEARYASCQNAGYFIDLTGDNFYSIRVKKRLIQMGALRVVYALGSIPEANGGKQGVLSRKIQKALEKGPVKLVKWALDMALRKLMSPLIRPELGIASGSKSLLSLGRANKIIHAHNLDYDIYVKSKNLNDSSAKGHVVFIDQNYCFHSDFIYEGLSFPVSQEMYFPAVSKAIHKIADELRITMCVAAHPRSTYHLRDQVYFEGMSIKSGATAELIKDCSVVLCHDSTAIQFAVLFEKPVIIVTTDELEASVWGASIAGVASALGKSVINIDRDLDKVDWSKELHIDYQKYAEYKNMYIKIDGSPEQTAWDILIDHIENSRG